MIQLTRFMALPALVCPGFLVLGCYGTPISLGEGVDELLSPDGPSEGPTGGAPEGPGAQHGGGAEAGSAEEPPPCDANFGACLESGMDPEQCELELQRCVEGAPEGPGSGYVGPDAAVLCDEHFVACLESESDPTVCEVELSQCEEAMVGASCEEYWLCPGSAGTSGRTSGPSTEGSGNP